MTPTGSWGNHRCDAHWRVWIYLESSNWNSAADCHYACKGELADKMSSGYASAKCERRSTFAVCKMSYETDETDYDGSKNC
jgi:hypothetical protein